MTLVALKSAADWCVKHSIEIPDDITANLYRFGVDVKTPGYYARVMWEAVRELYAGDIEAYDFEEVMLRLVSEQLRKAWNEGMRELNLDPQVDQTEEGEAYLQEIMTSELDYVGQLAEDILAAADNKIDVKGGEGSGNFGHEGRPGEVGGSGPGSGNFGHEGRPGEVGGSGPGGGSPMSESAKETVGKVSEQIRNDSRESRVYIDKSSGEVLYTAKQEGVLLRVDGNYPEYYSRDAASIVDMHNHPDNSPPSDNDWIAASSGQVAEMVIVGPSSEYHIIPTTEYIPRSTMSSMWMEIENRIFENEYRGQDTDEIIMQINKEMADKTGYTFISKQAR